MTDTITDKAPFYYFSFTDDGKLTAVNALICRTLGYTQHELVGTHVEQILTIAGRIFYHTHFFPLLRMHGHATEIFLSLQSRTKESYPVLINAQRNADGAIIENVCAGIAVPNRKKFEDELISARKHAETMLNENTGLIKLKDDLERRTNELDASLHKLSLQHSELRQFSKVITHDLQEPVRKLSLFIGMIKPDFSQAPEHTSRLMGRLEVTAEQLRYIVTGLQQFLWLTEHNITVTTTDLNEVLEAAMVQLKETLSVQTWQIQSDKLPVIDGDKAQLIQLFKMILENCIVHNESNENLQINIKSTVLAQNAYRSAGDRYRYQECVRIRFIDNGAGFDPAYNEYVFSLFTRLHDRPGRGLGLALCRKIAEHHNGHLKAEGVPDKGATVTLLLPLRHNVNPHNLP